MYSEEGTEKLIHGLIEQHRKQAEEIDRLNKRVKWLEDELKALKPSQEAAKAAEEVL